MEIVSAQMAEIVFITLWLEFWCAWHITSILFRCVRSEQKCQGQYSPFAPYTSLHSRAQDANCIQNCRMIRFPSYLMIYNWFRSRFEGRNTCERSTNLKKISLQVQRLNTQTYWSVCDAYAASLNTLKTSTKLTLKIENHEINFPKTIPVWLHAKYGKFIARINGNCSMLLKNDLCFNVCVYVWTCAMCAHFCGHKLIILH